MYHDAGIETVFNSMTFYVHLPIRAVGAINGNRFGEIHITVRNDKSGTDSNDIIEFVGNGGLESNGFEFGTLDQITSLPAVGP